MVLKSFDTQFKHKGSEFAFGKSWVCDLLPAGMAALRDQSGARGLQSDSSETGDSEMTLLIPMDKILDSAVYIFSPSNLKSSRDIGSGGSCLAAFPV